MESLLQDIRYAWRALRKSPRFSAVAILTLAVGIGANTAIFSVVNSVLLRPLQFSQSNQLVHLYMHNATQDGEGMTFLDFIDFRARAHSFKDLAAYWENDANLYDRRGPQKIRAACATADMFPLLDVHPTLGRTFQPTDDRLGFEHIALISYGLWQRRYGADPTIVGKEITVDSTPYGVAGVLPRGFHYPGETDVWLPMGDCELALIGFHDDRRVRAMSVVGRLQANVSVEKAQAETSLIADQLARDFPKYNAGWRARLISLGEDTVGKARTGLWTLMGAAGFVLLIGCANLGSLALARGSARIKEFAIRGALGGSRPRLIRQILTENVLLALIGGIVGAVLSYVCYAMILRLIPQDLPRLDEIHFDTRAFAFAFLLSLLTGLIFGWVPALQAGKADVQDSLKSGGRTSQADSNPRLRKLLMIGEVACAFVLLVGAALLTRSFVGLLDVQPGFNPQNLMTATVGFPDNYPSEKEQIRFAKQAIANLQTLPGVHDVGATSLLPLVNFKRQAQLVHIAGEPDDPSRGHGSIITVVTPGFFRTMQIPLVDGRLFLDSDNDPRIGAAVINETAARTFWPGQNPIGRHIRVSRIYPQDRDVVGVVGDVKQSSLALPSQAEMYLPFYGVGYTYLTFLVRTEGDPASMSQAIAAQIQKVDGSMPVYDVRTTEQLMSRSLSPNRSYLWLVGVFGLTAMALSAIGIYGLISFNVAQRTPEIGLRLALGALPGQLLRAVLSEGVGLTLAGIAVGLAGSAALTRVISSFLFDVKPTDPLSLLFVGIVLLLCALAASFGPAWRAAKVDPMVALRYE